MRPFALTIRAPRDTGYDIAESLGFDELNDALAVSVFDDGPNHVSVQALYETEAVALTARKTVPVALEVSLAQLPDTDWVSLTQAGLPPIDSGRFIVHGSHDSPPTDARIPVLVDAGMAFGTGHHGTTKGCLLMLSDVSPTPATILDLGTGAGLLAIAAAKLFPEAEILATDIDPDAVEVTHRNAALNGVTFPCVQADGFHTPALDGRQFDLVLANILAGPLREMAGDIAAAVAPGGTAILSGILTRQAEWVADGFRAHGLRVELQDPIDEWTSLLATKTP